MIILAGMINDNETIKQLELDNNKLSIELELANLDNNMYRNYYSSCNNDLEVMENLSNTYKNITNNCYDELEQAETKNDKLTLFNYQMFDKSSEFKQILINIAEANDYVANEYDCTEYSNDLKYKLNKKGWRSNTVDVVIDCDSGLFDKENCLYFKGKHTVVKVKDVYVEATSGNIILPKNYKIYGIRN
jgi:hypothetical protein